MGTHVPPHPLATQAAEGLPRRRWSVREIEAIVRAGIIAEDERFELIGGEVVPMSPKGARHEWVKLRLNRFFQRVAPEHLEVAPETTLRLDAHNFVEPDFCVFRRDLSLKKLNGPAVLLAVEVADSSLVYDTGRKIAIYAAFGVREVWVVDVKTAATGIYRGLETAGYAEISQHGPDKRMTPVLAPELAVCLTDLGISSAFADDEDGG